MRFIGGACNLDSVLARNAGKGELLGRGKKLSYIEHGVRIPMFDQRGELALLPFGYPIGPSTLLRMVSLPFEGLRAGLRVSLSRTLSLSNRSNHFVPASRGGVYIRIQHPNVERRSMQKTTFRSYIAISLCLFVFGVVGCSEDPHQLFETAQFEELQNNQSHARELYERIIQTSPDSKFAIKAKARLAELEKKSFK